MAEGRKPGGLDPGMLALSGLWVLVVLGVMLARSTYALELEWMEGGSVHQARRLLDGDPIYAAPSVDFIPFLYTPLYPALVALGGAVFGLSLQLARLISIAATVVAALALWKIVAQEGRSLTHRAATVGLFFAGYVFAFRWLDLARNDASFLALALWSLFWLRRADIQREQGQAWRPALVAGVLMALAFWTKQTASLFVVAGGLWTLRMGWRPLVAFFFSVAIIDGVGVLLGQAMTEGWLWTYIYELHQAHEFNRIRFTKKTWGMFLHAAPFLVALLAWRGLDVFRGTAAREDEAADRAEIARGRAFWGLMAGAALLASALGYSTQWAEPNAFVPGVAVGAVLCVLMCPPEFGASKPGRIAGGLLVAQMLFALVFEARYQPIQDRGPAGLADSYTLQDLWRTLPTKAKRERAAELRRFIAEEGSTLWAPQRPWWSSIGGGAGHLGSMGLNDIPRDARAALRRELRGLLGEGRYDRVWVEGSLAGWNWLRPTLAKHFRLAERRIGSERVLPMIGYMSEAGMVRPYTGPQLLFERIRPPELPAGWRAVADFEDPRNPGVTFEGAAFGRRSVPSIHSSHPAVGPIGGARFLSSAATRKGLRARGKAIGDWFTLPPRGTLHYLAGRTGKAENCSLHLEDEAGERQPLGLPATDWGLEKQSWSITPTWAGRKVRLVAVDENDEAALFVDELRLAP